MPDDTSRIEKKTLLRAPIGRVWKAISDAREFGLWFGVQFDGPFVAGQPLTGHIVPTTVDPEVARTQEPYRGAEFHIVVDRIEPVHHFSFRWHPFAVDSTFDYSGEQMTTVSFDLDEVDGGTQLTITESGFEGVLPERRATALDMNSKGWTAQLTLVAKYVSQSG